MRRRSRITSVYRKELIDILRDRRTVIGSVVIPVVLYPILVVGLAQVVEREPARVRARRFVVEVGDEAARQGLGQILAGDRARHGDDSQSRTTFEVRVGATAAAGIGPEVQVRLLTEEEASPGGLPGRARVRLIYNEADFRSVAAMQDLCDVLGRYRTEQRRARLGEVLGATGGTDGAGPKTEVSSLSGTDGRIDAILEPIEVTMVSTASDRERGGRMLSLIVPLVLLMMTITGAVYPAIDLTAGERERGTLEPLMTTPVPAIQLMMGKFLVVVTVAMVSAALNLASMAATMHLAGFTQAIGTKLPVELPLSVVPILLACMVPFAVLSSAVLVAVASFARTFREAQSYVMPTMGLLMAPGIVAGLPTTELKGVMAVVPVGNVVCLTRELLSASCTWSQAAMVVLSTSLYAAAAVMIAARLFGHQAVLFSDAGSYRTLLLRRYLKPISRPAPAQAWLLAAVLFPLSFYVQSVVGRTAGGDLVWATSLLALLQFAGLFAVVPICLALYFKIDVGSTFGLRRATGRAWVAALMLGASSWALAHELFVVQARVLPPSADLMAFGQEMDVQLGREPLWLVLVLIAVVPAVFEELFFRGFLLSGVSVGVGKWPAIALAGLVFSVYHFALDRVLITMLLGVLLGGLCWQSRSVVPGMLVHAMHNGLAVAIFMTPGLGRWLGPGAGDAAGTAHLPRYVLVPAGAMFIAGLGLMVSMREASGRRRGWRSGERGQVVIDGFGPVAAG